MPPTKVLGQAGGVERNKRLVFVLRRATWYGHVTTADIREAFDVSRQQASQDLHDAVEKWFYVKDGERRPILIRGRRQVVPSSYPPYYHEEASISTMTRLLACNAGFQETGLRDDECAAILQTGRRDLIDSVVMTEIFQSVIDRTRAGLNKRVLEIDYVGMKMGDTYRMRRVVPVGLEFDAGQVRLLAQDLDSPDYPIKAYVVARIRRVVRSTHPLPKDFVLKQVPLLKKTRFRVMFDPRLTADQKDALMREIGATPTGIVDVSAAHAHTFKRFYTNGLPPDPDQAQIVWPPIIFCERI